MAYGDVLVQVAVPEKPSGASETHHEYVDKVSKACSVHFIAKGINPARFQWAGRYDIPEAETDAPTFVESLLASTNINTGDFTFALANPTASTTYCVSNGYWDCYTGVIVTPTSSSTPNAFLVTVNLLNSITVDVPVSFVVRWRQKFPNGYANS